jgi:hypothetical protein
MSGLTRHRNAMHPPLNSNHVRPLPMRPPSPLSDYDGEDNPGLHEPIQGDLQTLHHPILNGISFICAFSF